MTIDRKRLIFLAVFTVSVFIGGILLFYYLEPINKQKEYRQPVAILNKSQSILENKQVPNKIEEPAVIPTPIKEVFMPRVNGTVYTLEDFILKFPELGLQVVFPPSTSISNQFYFNVVTAESVAERLKSYNEALDKIKNDEVGGTEYPAYQVDEMDINFFNKEKISFDEKEPFTYSGRSSIGEKEDYNVGVQQINNRWYLFYNTDVVFADPGRLYSTFVGDKRLDIWFSTVQKTKKEIDALFKQLKLIEYNPDQD